ncbi:MAG TPA: signal peptidase II [Gemmatimonadaceae bacterium]|nr:signal peptidase II [Gemmatimonadaceae bacterium]
MRRVRAFYALARVAVVVASVDLLSKLVALAALPSAGVALGDRLLLVAHPNADLAFGILTGAHALWTSVLLGGIALVLMLLVCGDLSRYDRHTPVAFGLLLGSGVGNLAEGAVRAGGTTDFIGVHLGDVTLFLNLADVACLAGVLLCARTAGILLREVLDPRPAAGRVVRSAATPRREVAARARVARPIERVAFDGSVAAAAPRGDRVPDAAARVDRPAGPSAPMERHADG